MTLHITALSRDVKKYKKKLAKAGLDTKDTDIEEDENILTGIAIEDAKPADFLTIVNVLKREIIVDRRWDYIKNKPVKDEYDVQIYDYYRGG